MMFPPAIIRIRIIERGCRKIRLWLPVFLLWPPLLLVAIAAIPFLLFLIIIKPFIPEVRRFLRKLHRLVMLSCSLRGLRIEFEDEEDEIRLQIV
ncbi:MAG: hypothetical protein KKG33_01095 [candidate division Zixibacteria bacterium]|nr:hypothetical protein [candidate division Zixibacteria bacterium]MBU1470643.1 hypothetical protein [candidate division Zixibacteria bacterium]MBU2624136.1 hypothetical protein [candidate division Zixibacteria bacterium]